MKPKLIPFAFAVSSGLLLAAAFPSLNLAAVAWLAPGLMLAVTRSSPFRLGYAAGLAQWLGLLHWLLHIPVKFAPILGWIAMSGVLAFYTATWCWLGHRFLCRFAAPRELKASGDRLPTSAPWTLLPFALNWRQRLWWPLVCGAAWVAMEMLRARLLSGFPWNNLGVSQLPVLPLIQLASVTGEYGVSFLVAWSSVALLTAVDAMLREPGGRLGWSSTIALPLLAVSVTSLWGLRRITHPLPTARELRVALIQPSIPQTLIWNPAGNRQRFDRVLALSESALAARPDLLIWPEASVPGLFQFDREIHDTITNLVVRHGVWLLFGADDADPTGPKSANYFNSAWLLNPRGEVATTYRKRLLVMFGEYIPFTRQLPFLKWFTPITSGYTPGDRAVPFRLLEPEVEIAPLVCFEDTFPHFVREHASPDGDLLVNITNDGWFGESSAQWQQAATAAFRAIENGRPLIRCANNGLTCWVDSFGAVHDAGFDDARGIYGEGFKLVRVPMASRADRVPTLYRRYGDVFGWSCVGMTGLLTIAGIRRRAG